MFISSNRWYQVFEPEEEQGLHYTYAMRIPKTGVVLRISGPEGITSCFIPGVILQGCGSPSKDKVFIMEDS